MPSRGRGFTLIEALVVIGIILILVAVTVPAAGRVWDSANATRCQSNIRTLTGAFLAFARDNEGHLPGARNSSEPDKIPAHRDWLFGQYSIWKTQGDKTSTAAAQLATAPQCGTLWPYVNSYQSYLCPSLRGQQSGIGIGSNGRCDYAAFSIFCGAKVSDINPVSELHFALDPNNPSLQPDAEAPFSTRRLSSYAEKRPTPIVCQEEASYNIQANHLQGQHCSSDQISHVHGGGSWYGSIDGAVYFVNEPDTDPTNVSNEGTRLWWQAGPMNGQWVALDGGPGAMTDSLGNGIGWSTYSHE